MPSQFIMLNLQNKTVPEKRPNQLIRLEYKFLELRSLTKCDIFLYKTSYTFTLS